MGGPTEARLVVLICLADLGEPTEAAPAFLVCHADLGEPTEARLVVLVYPPSLALVVYPEDPFPRVVTAREVMRQSSWLNAIERLRDLH